MNTLVKLLLFFLILIIGFAGIAFYWTFYKPLPDYEDTITLNGLNDTVDIHWDDFEYLTFTPTTNRTSIMLLVMCTPKTGSGK
jgi:hypothetical protein